MFDERRQREFLYKFGFVSKRAEIKGFSREHAERRATVLKRKAAQIKSGELDEKEYDEWLKGQVDEEQIETADNYIGPSGYPESLAHIKLVHESASTSIEEGYFWILEHLRQDRGFHDIIKILDIYAASEASAFWGNQQQRIAAQQNQASGFLANIGKFVKELFQMVRELRIIDERLEAYESWDKVDENGKRTHSESADVTLKSLWTDQVEGGTKNPQSVFGLAQTVGFTILPDLFFNTRVYSVDELDTVIERMQYNTSVKNVLRRKLYQFLVWRQHTHTELLNRRTFNIQYLKQHWAIIKMYIAWVKPHLRNVKRLTMRDDLERNPDMISSFDQSMTEVEILAKQPAKDNVYPVVLVNVQFRTRPEMAVRKEYQQGPSHMGRLQVNFRAYAWTEEEIEAYKRLKEQEDFELLGMLDPYVGQVMDSLGDEFFKYLEEQRHKLPEDGPKRKTAVERARTDITETLDPFLSVFGGFAELFGAFNPLPARKKEKRTVTSRGGAQGAAKLHMFLTFHIYKKAHRMLSW